MLVAGIQANYGIAMTAKSSHDRQMLSTQVSERKASRLDEKNDFAKLVVLSDLGMPMSRMSSAREAQNSVFGNSKVHRVRFYFLLSGHSAPASWGFLLR
jgi:hypothetical protein